VIFCQKVYSVTETVARGENSRSYNDWAIFGLDRPVEGRVAYTQVNPNPIKNEQLVMIGYPDGLPKKTDADGVVTSTGNLIGAFVDSFAGNSGSPVFDSRGRLVGLLVSGAQDYVARGTCQVSNICPGGPTCTSFGESIVPICTVAANPTVASVLPDLCSTGTTPPLANGTPVVIDDPSDFPDVNDPTLTILMSSSASRNLVGAFVAVLVLAGNLFL
jgi:hypothetical protein